MTQSQLAQEPRETLATTIVDIKIRKGLSWRDLADGTGLSVVFAQPRS